MTCMNYYNQTISPARIPYTFEVVALLAELLDVAFPPQEVGQSLAILSCRTIRQQAMCQGTMNSQSALKVNESDEHAISLQKFRRQGCFGQWTATSTVCQKHGYSFFFGVA